MIDGVLSKSFSSMNIPPSGLPKQSFIQEIIQYSRENYASLRTEVEKKIAHWELLDFSPSSKGSNLKIKKLELKKVGKQYVHIVGKKS